MAVRDDAPAASRPADTRSLRETDGMESESHRMSRRKQNELERATVLELDEGVVVDIEMGASHTKQRFAIRQVRVGRRSAGGLCALGLLIAP